MKIIGKTFAFVGIPFSLQGIALGSNGEQLSYGKYFWNFGDGDSRETRDSLSFSHTYFYSGEYPASLEYYTNYYSLVPDATAKIIIRAVPIIVSISRVGDISDFFIELSNNTDYEIDISKWVLSGDGKSFNFPRNTIIGSKKKIILSPTITNFNFEDAKSLKLSTDTSQLVFNYSASIAPAAIPARQDLVKTLPAVKPLEESATSAPDGLASVMENDAIAENSSLPSIPAIFAFIFIGTSAGAVYFLRQKGTKKIMSKAGDDFNILEE